MGEIASFVGGCLFTLFLGWVCFLAAYNVLDSTKIGEERGPLFRRKPKKPERDAPVPRGGVIRPKTQAEIDFDRSEETQELIKVLNGLGKE